VGAHGNSGGKENIMRDDGIGNYEKKKFKRKYISF
jgi:hypothetical protein